MTRYININKQWQTFINYLDKLQIKIGQCILCKGNCQDIAMLCTYCQQDLPCFKLTEQQHNNLLSWPSITQSISHQYYDQLYCLSPYLWPYSQWINQLKYQGQFQLANLLATLLQPIIEQIKTADDFTLLAVPSHLSRWQERGYNQAELIAERLRSNTGISCLNLIYRSKATLKQVGQSGIERRKNLKNAFKLTNNNEIPKHVIILDDVITTGTTVNEVSKLLRAAGVKTIIVVSVTLALSSR